nr:putative ABC transporter ATP-binding protein [Kibdelosporangium sp. MJ126-NF4]CTQ91250.1 putative ABC transporter ATP-binding protein [Kibdelosporangium sp. MJ126-NF4]
MPVPAVHMDGLAKHYGHTVAVEGVSLTIEPGEVFGFLGPNGAGKSTTIRMMLGLALGVLGYSRRDAVAS